MFSLGTVGVTEETADLSFLFNFLPNVNPEETAGGTRVAC